MEGQLEIKFPIEFKLGTVGKLDPAFSSAGYRDESTWVLQGTPIGVREGASKPENTEGVWRTLKEELLLFVLLTTFDDGADINLDPEDESERVLSVLAVLISDKLRT